MKPKISPLITVVISILLSLTCLSSPAIAKKPQQWKTKQVDLRLSGNQRIKAIYYTDDKPVPLLDIHKRPKAKKVLKKIKATKIESVEPDSYVETTVLANQIDSPPVDGFVPWIVVSTTKARAGDMEIDAVPTTTLTGSYPEGVDPTTDYAIGIYDTGASAHVMNSDAAVHAGLFDDNLVTSSTVELIGATGNVLALVSQPLGIFIDGLAALESNAQLIDTSNMVGETNVSIIVGDPIESPNLPTAIGSPLSPFFAAAIYNDNKIIRNRDNIKYVAPDIKFYDVYDPCIPDYPNEITMELRPSDGVAVQYFPCIEIPGIFDCPDGDGAPMSPSVITGFLPTQSLFFFPQVDLQDGTHTAPPKDGFMFDTGAQITVINSIVTAALNLNPNNPDFYVMIQDASGGITMQPGFFIDSLTIPAIGQALEYTNTPVIMLDITSPEGGILDGIIGMNLFVDYNFVIKGGGLPGYPPSPKLYFQYAPSCHLIADLAPAGGDCYVDYIDLEAFSQAYQALSSPTDFDYNPSADLYPIGNPDGFIDLADFAVFAQYWLIDLTE